MSQTPQRHFHKHRLFQQKRFDYSRHFCFSLTTAYKQQPSSSDVRAMQSRTTGARHRNKITCKSSLFKMKHWPLRRVARMGHD